MLTEHHPVEYAIDGTNRWWQSPSIKNGMEYHYVTITLDLKQVENTFIMSETLFTYFHCMPLFCFIYLFVLNRVTCLYQLASSNLSIDFLRYKVLEQQTGSSFIIRQIPLVMTHVHNSPI